MSELKCSLWVVKETHGEEKHSREELGFSLHRKRKSEFFSLYTPPKAGRHHSVPTKRVCWLVRSLVPKFQEKIIICIFMRNFSNFKYWQHTWTQKTINVGCIQLPLQLLVSRIYFQICQIFTFKQQHGYKSEFREFMALCVKLKMFLVMFYEWWIILKDDHAKTVLTTQMQDLTKYFQILLVFWSRAIHSLCLPLYLPIEKSQLNIQN